ncbi:hypothetical protein TSAR_011465 [Trichomalopsis sarcophagae]|uniref:Odorant receptor n=1 Tax=Trichomalopsis sarcophagae TaxID=543379 RepID=A0A232FDC6_9HYME|nr:hypothetical protein TSAR_011465 [Trichomalopsis sarcophagae]
MTTAVEEYDNLALPMIISGRACGSWPMRAELEGERSLRVLLHRLHRFLAILFLYLISAGVTVEVIVFFGNDMNETIESALVSSAFYMTFARVLTFARYQPQMLYVVETMREDWLRSTSEERAILRKKCLLAFKLTKFFALSVVTTGISFVIIPLLEVLVYTDNLLKHTEKAQLRFKEDAKKVLPYRGYFFYNYTQPEVYGYTYLANSMVGALGCTSIAYGTSFSLISTIHGAAKFAIVKRDFEKIDRTTWTDNKIVGNCVRRHQECIRFAETVEDIINILALAQFVISTGLMCFGGFQLTTMLEDRARLTKYTSFLNTAVTELFIFSFSGQSLKSEVICAKKAAYTLFSYLRNFHTNIPIVMKSEDVAEFAYTSNWIGSVLSTNLRMIILRSRKPCTITAGKFYDMSLESFLKVMSSSFSYFTVLLAMRDED